MGHPLGRQGEGQKGLKVGGRVIGVGRASCQPPLFARGFLKSSGGCWVSGDSQEREGCVVEEDGVEMKEEPAKTV